MVLAAIDLNQLAIALPPGPRLMHRATPHCNSAKSYVSYAPRGSRREAQGGKAELDLFVERIPIVQTRNCVRRVVGAWARYAYLRNPAAGWPLDLPAALQR